MIELARPKTRRQMSRLSREKYILLTSTHDIIKNNDDHDVLLDVSVSEPWLVVFGSESEDGMQSQT